MAKNQLMEREEDYFDLLYGSMSDGNSEDQIDKKNKGDVKSHTSGDQDEKLNETFELYADLSLEDTESGPSHTESKADRLNTMEDKGTDKVTDLDLYDDMLTEQDTEQRQSLEEKCREFEMAKKLIEKLEAENKKLKEDLLKQTAVSENVQKNMSSLLITARGEISRKDREISRLRKRHHAPSSHNYRNPLPPKEGHEQIQEKDKKKAFRLKEEKEENSRISANHVKDDAVQAQNFDRTRNKQNKYGESGTSKWSGSDGKVRSSHSKPEIDVSNYRLKDTDIKSNTLKETVKKDSANHRSETTGTDDKSYKFKGTGVRNASSNQNSETGDSKRKKSSVSLSEHVKSTSEIVKRSSENNTEKDNYQGFKHKGLEFHSKEYDRKKVDYRKYVMEEQLENNAGRDGAKKNDFESKNNQIVQCATERGIYGRKAENGEGRNDVNERFEISRNRNEEDGNFSDREKRHGKFEKSKSQDSESSRENKDGKKERKETDRIRKEKLCEKRVIKDKSEIQTKTDAIVGTKVKVKESVSKELTDLSENKRLKTSMEKNTDRMDIHVTREKKQFSGPKVLDLREILKQKRSLLSNKPSSETDIRIESCSIHIDKEGISKDKVFNKDQSRQALKEVNEHFKNQNEIIFSEQKVDSRQENTELSKDKHFLESIKRNDRERRCPKAVSDVSSKHNCDVSKNRSLGPSSCFKRSNSYNGRDLVSYEDFGLYSKSTIESLESKDEFSGHEPLTNSMIKLDGKTSTNQQHSKLSANEKNVYRKVQEKNREINNESKTVPFNPRHNPKSDSTCDNEKEGTAELDVCGKNQKVANNTYEGHIDERSARTFQNDELKRKGGSKCGSNSDEVFSEIEPVYTANKVERRRSSEKKKKNYRRVTSETISSVTSSEESPSVEEFLRNLRQECESKDNERSQISNAQNEIDMNDKGKNCAAKDDIKVKHPLCSKEGCHIKVNHIHPKSKLCSELVDISQAQNSFTSSASIDEDEIPCSSVDSTKIFSENTEYSYFSFSKSGTDTQTNDSTNDPQSSFHINNSNQGEKSHPCDPSTKCNALAEKPFGSQERMLEMSCAESVTDVPTIDQDKPVSSKNVRECAKDQCRSENKNTLNDQSGSEKNQSETDKSCSPMENKNTRNTGIQTVNGKRQNTEKDIELNFVDNTAEKMQYSTSSLEDDSSSSDDESKSYTNSEFYSSSTADSSSSNDESSDERKTVKSCETEEMKDNHSTTNYVDSLPLKSPAENTVEHEKFNSVVNVNNIRINSGSETVREPTKQDSTHHIELNHRDERNTIILGERNTLGDLLKDPDSTQSNRGRDRGSPAKCKTLDISTVLDKNMSEKAYSEKTEALQTKSFLLQSLLCGIDMVVQQKKEDEKYLSKKIEVRNESHEHSGKSTVDRCNITQSSVNKSPDKKETAGNKIYHVVQNKIRTGTESERKEQALERTNTGTVKIDSDRKENSFEDKVDINNRTLNIATTVTNQNVIVDEYDRPGKAYELNRNKDTCDHEEVNNSIVYDENNKHVVNDLGASTVEKNIFGSLSSLSSDDSNSSTSSSESKSDSDSMSDSDCYSSGSESSDDESDKEDKTLTEPLKMSRNQSFSKTMTVKDGQSYTHKTHETISSIGSKPKGCSTGSEEPLVSQGMERHNGHDQNKYLVNMTNACSNSLMLSVSSDRSDGGVAPKVCNNPYMIQDELPKFMCDNVELEQTETKAEFIQSPQVITVLNRNMVVPDAEENIKKKVQQTSQKKGEHGSTSDFYGEERSPTVHNIPNRNTFENFDNKGKYPNERTKETQCKNDKIQRACPMKLSKEVKKDQKAIGPKQNKKEVASRKSESNGDDSITVKNNNECVMKLVLQEKKDGDGNKDCKITRHMEAIASDKKADTNDITANKRSVNIVNDEKKCVVADNIEIRSSDSASVPWTNQTDRKVLSVKEKSLYNTSEEKNCGQTENIMIKSSDSGVVPRCSSRTGLGNSKEMCKSDSKVKKQVPMSTTLVKNQPKCSQMASKSDKSVSGSILRLVSKSSESVKEKSKKPKSQLASPKKMPNKALSRDSISNKQKPSNSGIAKNAKLTFEHKALTEYKDPANELTESLVKLTAYHDRVKELEKRQKDQEKKSKKAKKSKTPPSTYLQKKAVISSDTEDYDIDEVNVEGNSISSLEFSSLENFTTCISFSPKKDSESEEKREYHLACREEDHKNLKIDNAKTRKVPQSFESVLVDLENYQLVNANRKTKSKRCKSGERNSVRHDNKSKQDMSPRLSVKMNANQTSRTKEKMDANTSVAVKCSKSFTEKVQEGQQELQAHSTENKKKTDCIQNKDLGDFDRVRGGVLDKVGVNVNATSIGDKKAVEDCSSSEDSYTDSDSSESDFQLDRNDLMVRAIFGSSDTSAEREKKSTSPADQQTTRNKLKKERKKKTTEVIQNLDDKLIKLYSSRRKEPDSNPVSKSTDVITGKLSEENTSKCESICNVQKSLSPRQSAKIGKNTDKVDTVKGKTNESMKAETNESVNSVKAKTNESVKTVKMNTYESVNTMKAKTNQSVNTLKAKTNKGENTNKAETNEGVNTFNTKTNEGVNTFNTKTNEGVNMVKAKMNKGVNTAKAKTNESVNTVKAKVNESVNSTTCESANSVKNKTNKSVNIVKAKANECVNTLKAERDESLSTVKANINEAVDRAKAKTNERVNTVKFTESNKDSARSGNIKEKSVTDFILEDTDVLDVIDYEDDLSLGLNESELEIPDPLNDADAPKLDDLQNEHTCEGYSTPLEDGEVSGDCETGNTEGNDKLSEKLGKIIIIPKKGDGRPGPFLESAKPFSPIKFPSPTNSPSTPDRKIHDDCYESANTQCLHTRATLSKRKRSMSDSNSDGNHTPVRKADARNYRHRSRSPKMKRHVSRSDKSHTSRRSPSPKRAGKSARSRSISRSRNKKSRSRSGSGENSEDRYRTQKNRSSYKRIGRKSSSERSSSDEDSARRRYRSYGNSKDRLSRRRKSDSLNKYDSPYSERKRYSRNVSRKGSDSDNGRIYDRNSNKHRLSNKKSKLAKFVKGHDDSSPYRERYSEKDRSSHKRRYMSSSDDEYILVKKTELKRRRSERSKTPQLPDLNNLMDDKDATTLRESSRRKNSSEKENVTSPYCKKKGDSGRKIFQHRVI